MCAAVLCCVPTAQAATATGTRVFSEEGVQGLPDSYVLHVRYDAATGEENRLTATINGEELVLQDPGAEIEVRGECTSTGPHRAVCSSSDDDLSDIRVNLGDRSDQFGIETDVHTGIRVSGDAGDDVLQGGVSSDSLHGGAGNDVVDGGPGSDTVNGGGGRDELRGGEPGGQSDYDFIHDGERDGSAASDTIVVQGGGQLDYGSRRKRVTVDLAAGVAGAPGERDTFTGISAVIGGAGPDVMLGTARFDFFRGGPGADRLEGRGSRDLLYGQGGPDRVFGGGGDDVMSDNSDNARDIQSCGSGEDWVQVSDKRDLLRPSCEDGSWLRSRRADESRVTAQPAISRRRVVFRLTCADSDGCLGRITLKAAGRRLALGRGGFDIERRRNRHRVVVRLNARGREYVRRGGHVRVVIFGSGRPCGCSNPRPVKTGFTVFMRR
jgi:hypothetical protein